MLTLWLLIAQNFTSGRPLHPDRIVVWIFDVGQGDTIFIDAPDRQILIDGGPDGVVIEKLTAVMPFWDREIDLVIDTHPHADHIMGLVHVLDRYQVEEVWTSGLSYETPVHTAFKERTGEALDARAGEVIDLGQGATLTILWPTSQIDDAWLDDPNAGSVVTLLEYGDASILLTGDIGFEEEEALVVGAYGHTRLRHVDVLKVGHHGSPTSTSRAFLETITPDFAVISSGENTYGHPSPVVLDRLRAIGAAIFRTDTSGDIRIVSDGAEPSIRAFDL